MHDRIFLTPLVRGAHARGAGVHRRPLGERAGRRGFDRTMRGGTGWEAGVVGTQINKKTLRTNFFNSACLLL